MTHKIKEVEFVGSYTDVQGTVTLNALPGVAVIGRSNVGKSSFINTILGSGKIAKTGKTPGKTRLINYFLVNGRHYVVDLPGYGYANLSKTERENLLRMIRAYLAAAPNLYLIVQLFDIRIGVTENDREYFTMMYQSGIPVYLIANKVDKLPKNKVLPATQKISAQLGVDVLPTVFSSLKKINADEVRNRIFDILSAPRKPKSALKQEDRTPLNGTGV